MSELSCEEIDLLERIKAISEKTHHSYGSRRMAKPLQDEGYHVGRFKGRRVMKQAGVTVLGRRRQRPKTTPSALAQHLPAAGGTRRTRRHHRLTQQWRQVQAARQNSVCNSYPPTLQAVWAQVALDWGQVVRIVGKPGLGKSRLVDAFRRSLRGTPRTYVQGRCLSYGTRATPYLPLPALLRQACGVTGADLPASIALKVSQRLDDVDMASEAGPPRALAMISQGM